MTVIIIAAIFAGLAYWGKWATTPTLGRIRAEDLVVVSLTSAFIFLFVFFSLLAVSRG